jgi:hypothetical protein
MPWQQLVADVALELDPATGLPAYREVRLTVPRQSGKTTLLLAAMIDRCLWWGNDQRCVYAAQDRINSRAKWEEHGELLLRTPFRHAFTTRRQTGLEATVFPSTRSQIAITASGETSGHGRTLDLGVIDEAFAQRDERLAQAFRPAMLTRPSAQMWVVSTMGYPEGSEFLHSRVDDGRARVEADERHSVCYFEWSASDDDDPDDPATWWKCMPALGYTVTESVVQADHDAFEPSEFSRAYLNRRAPGGRPVIDLLSWRRAHHRGSQLGTMPCLAVDVTPERGAAAIAVAGWRPDGRVHVEIVEHGPGTDWVVGRLAQLEREHAPLTTVVDPGSPAGSLLTALKMSGVPTTTMTARDYAQSCGQFYDLVAEDRLAHLDQPTLNTAVAAARKRPLGDAWAWARRTGGDISPLVAATLACWGLARAGQGSIQIL